MLFLKYLKSNKNNTYYNLTRELINTMDYDSVTRVILSTESTGKYKYGGKKPVNGDKRRRCEEYALKRSNYVRRKQTKVNYDTWRREDITGEKDEMLANLHYANFLGDKYGDHGAPYNNSAVIKLKACDCMCEEYIQEKDDSTLACGDSLDDDMSSVISLGSNKEDEDEDEEEEDEEEDEEFDRDFPIEIGQEDQYEEEKEEKEEQEEQGGRQPDEEFDINAFYIQMLMDDHHMTYEEATRNATLKRLCGDYESAPSSKRRRCDDDSEESFNICSIA